jgi:capsular polysaccharide transport system ATP-binding protein
MTLISFCGVTRTVQNARQVTKTLLRGIDWKCEPQSRIAILSANQSEADSFLECAAGTVPVQQGKVITDGRVSWPLGETEALLGVLTPNQNAAFLQRIYGCKLKREEQLQLIRQLSDFNADLYDKPLKLSTSAMKSRLRLAISLAFDFDLYAVPKMPAWPFRSSNLRAQRFKAAFEKATFGKAILVSNPNPFFQDAYCDKAVVIENGSLVLEGDLSFCRDWLNERVSKSREYVEIPHFEEPLSA